MLADSLTALNQPLYGLSNWISREQPIHTQDIIPSSYFPIVAL